MFPCACIVYLSVCLFVCVCVQGAGELVFVGFVLINLFKYKFVDLIVRFLL